MCKFVKILERAGGHKPQSAATRRGSVSAPVVGAASVAQSCLKLFDLRNKADENEKAKNYLTKDDFAFLGDILSKNWDEKQNEMLMGKLDPRGTGKVYLKDFEVTP